jgi:pimeloyl-ACP methyl ester carboxylesterase
MNFVRLYPSEVAGLVFVDPSHPDQLNRFAKVFNETHPPPIPLKLRLATWLAWLGYARWFPEFRATPRAPDRVRAEADAYVSTSAGPLLREQESIAQTLIQAGRLRHLGDRPVIVLTAVDTMAPEDLRDLGWTAEQGNNFLAARKALHEDEASWSSHGRDQLVMGSTHYIQFDKPQAVINAVSEVIAVVQGNCPASNIPHLTTLLFAAQACQKPKECMGNCGA